MGKLWDNGGLRSDKLSHNYGLNHHVSWEKSQQIPLGHVQNSYMSQILPLIGGFNPSEKYESQLG